jgi:hypothetical protein
MPCPRCSGFIDPRANIDGDRECVQCGFVLYEGQDASEVYWKQLQANLAIVVAAPVVQPLGKGKVPRRAKRYGLTA